MASSSEQNNRNCWPSNTVIQEAVEVNLSGRQGVDARPLKIDSKVKVTFINCRSDQKKKGRKKETTHTHTRKCKLASLNTWGKEKFGFFFPQM